MSGQWCLPVVGWVGVEERVVFETENPHHGKRFLLWSWSERGREGSEQKEPQLLLARVWGEGLALSSAPHSCTSCCWGGRCLIALWGPCAGMEEHF